jgi:anti-anti-sigma factor
VSTVELERIEGITIARIHEDVDAANANIVKRELGDALGPDATGLVVDLSDTRYVDSAGIDMMLRLSERLEHRRAKLVLLVPEASQLRRLFAIVGLPAAVAVRSDLPGALDAATPRRGAGSSAPADPGETSAGRSRT